MTMDIQDIETLSASITAKTGTKFLWHFAIILLAMAGLYYGLTAKIDNMQAQMEVRKVEANGKFDVINSNIENIKSDLKDVKSDVKDVKETDRRKK